MFKKFLFVAACVTVLACGVQAADFSKIPDPTTTVKEGQWVSYTSMGGNQKQTVTKVEEKDGDKVITMKMEMTMGEQKIDQDVTISAKDSKKSQEEAWAADPDVQITDEKITIKGTSYDAIVVTAKAEGSTVKMYMSEKIPVTHLLKMEIVGMPMPIMELDSFGDN